MKRAPRSLILAIVATVLLAVPASGASIRHIHADDIQNIEGSCDIIWNHTNYTDDVGFAYTDELSSCTNVQAIVRWYSWGIGWTTNYGPQVNDYSSVYSGDVQSILWSRHCGNATCTGQLS